MKKITFVLFLSIIPVFVFSTELWNGFTTDMNEEQFISKAKEVLEIGDNYEKFENMYLPLSFDYKGNPEDVIYYLTSPQSQYCSYSGRNLIAYFYNEKLFAITVLWELSGKKLLKNAQKKWGKSKQIPTGPNSSNNFSFWEFSDKYIYLVSDNQPASIAYVDKHARIAWLNKTETEANIQLAKENEEKVLLENKYKENLKTQILPNPSNKKELWNGFLLDMFKDDCKKLAKQKFNLTSEDDLSVCTDDMIYFPQKNFFDYFSADGFSIKVSDSHYSQYYGNEEYNQDLEQDLEKNIEFYFYENKLYAIYVLYSNTENDMVQKATEIFNSKPKKLPHPTLFGNETLYFWELETKYVYEYRGQFMFINKQASDDFENMKLYDMNHLEENTKL